MFVLISGSFDSWLHISRNSRFLKLGETFTIYIYCDVSVFKDLGVTFDRSLTFVDHITKISDHAMKLLGFITRNTKHFANIFTLKNLYCSIVRSGLEYASPVWSPHCKIHIQKLERVERKFVRYLAFKLRIPIMNLSYEHIYFTRRNKEVLCLVQIDIHTYISAIYVYIYYLFV